jgi:serine/threonine protein kinase
MILCLNPNCQQPENPDRHQYCQNCGTQLLPLLRDRYRILSHLGKGGFGKTYLAEDIDRRGAKCVVKQFAPAPEMQASPQILAKANQLFEREADQLLNLEEHPQIPTLYAYFKASLSQAGQKQPLTWQYLVQQYIPGSNLLDELEQDGPKNERQIRELLADILPILEFVHKNKVIHRDIKPENIMRRAKDGKLILIDFGVARLGTGTLLTQQGTTVGTVGYAPTEQMRGVAYPASDLYSLAVTSVRLMTGCFIQEDGSDPLYDNFAGNWVWRKHLPKGTQVSQQLGQVLDKMLCDYAKERYQSAKEVLAALASPTQASQQGGAVT